MFYIYNILSKYHILKLGNVVSQKIKDRNYEQQSITYSLDAEFPIPK